uniref:Uncharacterized protein n=1 Tax=Helianthus annuus TaxID=4232 RepID=A0A251UHR1_HELAN
MMNLIGLPFKESLEAIGYEYMPKGCLKNHLFRSKISSGYIFLYIYNLVWK